MEIAELAEKYGSLDLLTAYIMRTANVSQEKAEERVVDLDFSIEQQLSELTRRCFICRKCGAEFEFDADDFDCGGEFHPDGEEVLWDHLQLSHPDLFEEVRDFETPDMIEECYEEVED